MANQNTGGLKREVLKLFVLVLLPSEEELKGLSWFHKIYDLHAKWQNIVAQIDIFYLLHSWLLLRITASQPLRGEKYHLCQFLAATSWQRACFTAPAHQTHLIIHTHTKKKPFWNRHPLLNLISESTSRSTSTAEAVNTSNGYFVISCCVQEISSQPVQIFWRYFCVDESGGLTSKRWCCFSSKNKDCIFFFPFYNTSAPFFEVISCKSRFYLSYSLAF